MPLAAGTQLGPYEIIELLGAGGMGEVYRARDPRLNREVAVKVSAAQFGERFEREARAVAALNHPNICTLFDVGPNYLVMELVEGESPKGPLPLETALDYARQIAAALEAAHDKGIIHRDLKPANVRIKPDGTVKVLDFGLAKVAPVSAGNSENSPTISMAATQAGVILGTAAYMSPEQAKGKPVDKRADIWAFGVVFYELVTGRQPFRCDDVSETLASVIMKDPDLDAVPAQIRKLLKRCLEKDPRKRLRDITGMELLLEEAPAFVPAGTAISSPAKASRLGMLIATAAAALFLLAAAALAFVHFRETPPPAEVMRFQIQPPEKGSFTYHLVLSPDGQRGAFIAPGPAGNAQIWVRSLASLDMRPLAGTDGLQQNILWSADSRSIAFEQRGKLRKVEAAGGLPQTICDVTGGFRGGAWNRDGVVVFSTTAGMWRVPAAGGTATQLTAVDSARQENNSGPVFLPDQQHFLYHRTFASAEGSGIYLGSLDFPKGQQGTKRVLASDGNLGYVPSPDDAKIGYLLFLREGQLMAQTFDNSKLDVTGEAVPIAESVGNAFQMGYFSASDNGLLAFRGGGVGGKRQYVWFDRQGKNLGAAVEPGTYGDVSLSPDGTRLAGDRQSSTAPSDLWLLEFSNRVSTQFTFDPAPDGTPVWSPDGAYIVFGSEREGSRNLYKKASSGAGSDELLFKSPETKRPKDWSRDGKFLLYNVQNPKTGADLFALPMTGDKKEPIPVVATEAGEDQGQFSPDSQWVAYRSNASGRHEIYIQPFPVSGGAKWRVSDNGGVQPRWNRNGKELFYIDLDRKLMAVDVSTAGGTVKSGTPQPLFETQIYGGPQSGSMRWDVARDGQRFLINSLVTENGSSPVTVIVNWPELLKK